MNWKQMVVALVFVEFAAFTGWAFYSMGWTGSWGAAFATAANVQVALDLTLGLAVGVGLMWADARRSGINPMPYAVVTCLTGSFGLLAYAVKRLGASVVAA